MVGMVGAAGAAQADPSVDAVRVGIHGGETRVVLDVSAPVAFRLLLLDDPYRLVIDLARTGWRAEEQAPPPRALVTGYRFGRFADDTSRIVLDLAGPAKVVREFALPPQERNGHRIVVDLVPTDRASFAATTSVAAALPPAARARPAWPPLPVPRPASPRLRLVAIDAGHGGADPGTIGASGTFEKDVTLAAARELRDALAATGRYRVVLTRDGDEFIRLRDRIARAREANAELFVSLHADSIGNAQTRGASVYTLSQTASDAEAAALAAKENRADLIAGLDLSDESADVTNILIDLTQRETMNLSARYANFALPELRKAGPVLAKGHRFAGFAVLKAPDIPSVLVELGYLSNRDDERRLLSQEGRRRMIDALVAATDTFFATAQPVAAAN